LGFVFNTGTCGAHFNLTTERCIFPAATIWTKTTFSSLHVWFYESYGRNSQSQAIYRSRCLKEYNLIKVKLFTAFSNITVGKCDFFKIHTVEEKESIYCTNKSQNKHNLVRRYFLLFNKNEQYKWLSEKWYCCVAICNYVIKMNNKT